jgi:hypothetical protein
MALKGERREKKKKLRACQGRNETQHNGLNCYTQHKRHSV